MKKIWVVLGLLSLGLSGLALPGQTVLVVWDSTQAQGAQAFKGLVDMLKEQRAQGHFVGTKVDPAFRIYDAAVPEHARALKSLGLGRLSQPEICLTWANAQGVPQKLTWHSPISSPQQAMGALDQQLGIGLATVAPTPSVTPTPSPAATLAVMTSGPTPSPPTPSHFMREGQALPPDQFIESDNGAFRVLMQKDGNCVVYRSDGQPNWESGSDDPGSELRLERTGLLQVITPNDRSVWHSSYEGVVGFYRLRLLDDGDLIVELQRGSEWIFCWSSLRGSEGHWKPSPGLRLDRGRGHF
jgi:hypothetical protein